MIRLKVSGGNFDPIIAMLDRMAHPDLMPLAQSVKEVMLKDNREGLLRGEDRFGDPMAPVEASTIRRGRGGDGEPLVPRSGASRAIADYQVDIQEGFDRIILVGSWPNTPFIKYHVTGYVVHTKNGDKGVPARDPVGIRPQGEILIAEAMTDYVYSELAMAS